jgi:raffinose/stachyose/melibiose transport system substrate-binding protein
MTQHKIARRARWTLIAIPAIAALALTACTGDGGDTDASGEAASGFSFAFPQANDSENFYQDFAKAYEDETGVKIELIPIPGDSAGAQLQTEFQAGNAADLTVVPPGSGNVIGVIPLATSTFIAPLSDASAATIPDGAESLYTVDDEVYGQPTSLSAYGLLWSASAAEKAGVEFPENFDDLLDACGTARDAGMSLVALAGSVPANLGFLAQVISATRVYAEAPSWNQERAEGTVTFADSDGWKQVLEDFVAMNDAGCFQDGAAGGGFDAITNGLVGGTAVAASIPGEAAAALNGASQNKAELDVHAFPPAGSEQPYLIASTLYAWVKNAKSDASVQEAVQKFLDWAAEPAQSVKFAELAGNIPIVSEEGTELLPQYAPVTDLITSGSFAPEPNAAWPTSAVYDALGTGMQGLLTGQTTVDAILASMDDAWDK